MRSKLEKLMFPENCVKDNAYTLNLWLLKLKQVLRAILVLIIIVLPATVTAQAAASSNYTTVSGEIGTTYSWIDCSLGIDIVDGDDAEGSFSWPFTFTFYDNTYTTANSISVATNGFIRLDGTASTSYSTASAYTLSSSSTELGQIIATSVYDCNVGDIPSSWIKHSVTGSEPNRILTIEYSDIEINYSAGLYANVQVSFYETLNTIVLKFEDDDVSESGVEMGIHSGVSGYFNEWQEVASGTNNSWIEYTPGEPATPPTPPAASWNYGTQTGAIGTTYSWIDCTSGNTLVSGDDDQAQIAWPFNFYYYDNYYTTGNTLSVATNGFIRLDDEASTDYSSAQNYSLSSTSTDLGQIIAMAVYDGKVGDNGGWVRSLLTGSEPDRVFTIEYNNLEIDYDDASYVDVQLSFYESINKIVLKLGAENISVSGVDMGLHSGVDTYFDSWQEVLSGTNNTWIEYLPPYVEVEATIGSSSASYSTLKSAFDKINDGTHQGEITIKINHSTTEPSSAVLNASGTGAASYASINVYPTETGLSISGNVLAALIDLNGAENVIIDGRVNASGTAKDLSIINTSTVSYGGNSAIRFINGASSNTIKYCTIKSSESNSTYGIIFFSTTTSSSGNDNNVIENNDITNAADVRPVNAIYSMGTSGKANSGNIIRDNNIYDFFKPASASKGILLADNTTAWTIDGNSFYETSSYSAAGTVNFDVIKIDNVSGNGFTISNNYFGGSAAQCGGAAWTKTNATNNVFNVINLNVGTTLASSVQNNTIQNFNWSNSAIATWAGINVIEGSVNIGTITGNTIGATTGTNSISVTGGANGQSIYGIKLDGAGVLNCNNNSIGSITGLTGPALATDIYGIGLSGSAVANIEDNTIGSTSEANSIYASSTSTANLQKLIGIYTESTGTTVIHGNTISNLKNNTSNAEVGTKGTINGIYLTAGTNTVSENTINDLSIANANISIDIPSVAGIHLNTTTEAQSIHQNLIYNISNTYSSFIGSVAGIFTNNSVGASAGDINANFVHSLSVDGASTGAKVYGIYEDTDGIVYSNNIITLGGNTSTEMYGIYDVGNTGKTGSFYFNSIYIAGTNSGAEDSYAFRFSTNSNTRDLRNNILFNARSGGSGSHYAIYYDATGGTFTGDYNDYYVSGTGGMIAYYGGDQNTLTLLRTATGQDVNSLDIDPSYIAAGGSNSSDYVTLASLPGIAISGISTTYNGITRNDPPKIGALEVSPTSTWQGDISTDFSIASNWSDGGVPPNGASILFSATAANDCYLDQDRTLKDITNTSSKKLVVNAKQLTITGAIGSATANQIDASAASSGVIFAGTEAQNIPNGGFVSNTIDALTLNNEHGLTQNGDLVLSTAFTLTNGDFVIGANTLTLNGTISTTSGSLTGGSTTNIVIGGSGTGAILPGVSLNMLTLNRANGISLGGSVSVAGTLALTAGTLTVGENTLTVSGSAPTRVSGNIDASDASASLEFTNSSAITLAASLFNGNINNLLINGAGLTAASDLTINGILNLESANPSVSKGSLDMSSYILSMGVLATTTGIGDVVGTVKREHVFTGNVAYSYGNQFTTVTFVNSGTKPSWLSCKIVLNNILPGKDASVLRYYSFAEDAATYTDQTIVNLHYLDAELNGNTEEELVFWDKDDTDIDEHGKTNHDETNNWVGLSGLSISYLAPSTTHPSATLWGLSDAEALANTWSGASSTEWNNVANWTGGMVPTSTSDVLIPITVSGRYPILTASSNAVASTLEIESGASITADSYNIDISGSTGAWHNDGTFIPGTGTVSFSNGDIDNVVSLSGSSVHSFYNLEVLANTYIQPSTGTTIQIENNLSQGSNSILDFMATSNTIEYSGASQSVINPIGPGTDTGYNILFLSGSGTKTMPGTAMTIADELQISGTASVTAASALSIGAEFEILEDATFGTGNFDHTVGGSFDNRGTFIASAGTEFTMNGTTMQEIYGGASTTFEKLTINNAAGVNIYNDLTINNTLTLTSGIFDVGSTTLTINGDITKTSGFISTEEQSSLTFGGTTALSLASDLFYAAPSIDILTINRTEGVIFGSDLTINGELNLQGANPSSGTIGSLDMGTATLMMGAMTTTTGVGDVTGIIKREHSFTTNTAYDFGSQYTTIVFIDGNLTPTWISVKVSIGSVPTWSPWTPDGKVKRLYQLSCSDNSSTAQTNINMRYLESELDASNNDEAQLVFWHKYSEYLGGIPHEHGKATQDFTNHTLGVTGLILGTTVTADLDDSQVAIAYSETIKITWTGTNSSDWENGNNWSSGTAPLSTDDVLIPSGPAVFPSLTSSANAVAGTLEIETGASITANSYDITVSGAGGAWINEGTFIPGTGTVIFDHGVSSELVTVAGTTDFYNIQIGDNTSLVSVSGCTFRVAGAATGTATSKSDWSAVNSTVEWNGTDQNINNPQGIGGDTGYYNLILSGSGTKTMPSSAMTINGDFSTSGTASATAANSIVVIGNTTIGSGSTFATGAQSHSLQGDFANNGTLIPTSGGTIIFSGTSAQTISGTSISNFDNLSIENTLGVSQGSDINVSNVLAFNDGFLSVGAYTLGINGTIINPSGNIEVSTSSSLSFGGTSAITLNNNLFNGDQTVNNLTINRSGGVTLGNESLTVSGALALTSGTLTLAANTLIIAENSPTRTSGDIDASNALASLEFTNTSAIILPASVFSGNVNNMTINGAGGVTAVGDFTMNGILNLQSANPSDLKGSLDMSTATLSMGEDAKTIGIGDVTGIVRRSHTFTANAEYTFGSEYTSISFLDVGTLPTEMSVKISLGSSPSWKTGAIKRVYDLTQTGGAGTEALIHIHYLDSELNGNDEDKLIVWLRDIDLSESTEYGRSNNSTTDNWLAISNVNVGVFPDAFGEMEISLDEYENVNLTWNGSISTSWVTVSNWTPNGAPSEETIITIPDASTTNNDPTIPEIAICGKMIIESGGVLNSSSGGQLTVTGSSGAWSNNGTFNAETGTIIFSHDNDAEIVTLEGVTNFNNLVLSETTWFQPLANSIINIAGQFSADSRCKLDFNTNENTVDYNSSKAQDIIDLGAAYSYYHLTLSGSGVKTLASIDVLGDFILSGTTSAVAGEDITIDGNWDIGSGTTFTTGANTISLSGNFSNDGILVSTGSDMVFDGILEQTIEGSSASTFDDLTIDNVVGVVLNSDELSTVEGALTINNGMKLTIAASSKLTVTGSLTNDSDATGLIIESTSLGTGSLIHSTAGVEASVQRYMRNDSWHVFSPSVTGQSIPNFVGDVANNIPINGSTYGMMSYSESGGGWQYYSSPASGDIVPGTGYLLRHTTDDAVSYHGALTAVNTTVDITKIANGWNAVGNPFPCAIGITDDASSTGKFLNDNVDALNPSYAALYLWDEPDPKITGVSYYKVVSNAPFTSSKPILDMAYIQPGQGFIIKSKVGGSTLSFSTAMRVHDNTELFVKKAARTSWPGIILSVASEDKTATTSIAFNEHMTKGLDITYDAGMFGGDPSFKLYSRLVEDNGINFMLQCLPNFDFEKMVIPLGFDCTNEGTVSFSAETIQLPSGCGAFIEDRQLEIFTDIGNSSSSYSVDLESTTTGIGRFYLHLAPTVSEIHEPNNSMLSIYLLKHEIIVKGQIDPGSLARLVDLSGRIIKNYELYEPDMNILPAKNIPSGIYILQIYGKTINENKKLLLK